MRGRAMALGVAVGGAVVLGGLVSADSGDKKHVPGSYKADWGPGREGPLGRRVPPFRRDRRRLVIEVRDGTCSPQAPARETDPRRRFRYARVRETPHRVIVSVVMRSERSTGDDLTCAGVGRDLLYAVRLPHPVGRRAVVRDEAFDPPETPIVYPAQDRSVQAQLLRGYLAPAARSECEETPKDVLAMKYDTRSTDDRAVARAAAESAPGPARAVVFRACLAELRRKD